MPPVETASPDLLTGGAVSEESSYNPGLGLRFRSSFSASVVRSSSHMDLTAVEGGAPTSLQRQSASIPRASANLKKNRPRGLIEDELRVKKSKCGGSDPLNGLQSVQGKERQR